MFAIGRPVGEVIANGEAEVGMQQIIEILPVEGSARCQASWKTSSFTQPASPEAARTAPRPARL